MPYRFDFLTTPLKFGVLVRIANEEHGVNFTGPMAAFTPPAALGLSVSAFCELGPTQVNAKVMTFTAAEFFAKEPGIGVDGTAAILETVAGFSPGKNFDSVPLSPLQMKAVSCLLACVGGTQAAAELAVRIKATSFTDVRTQSMSLLLHWAAIGGNLDLLDTPPSLAAITHPNFFGATPALLAKLNGNVEFHNRLVAVFEKLSKKS